MPDPSNQNAVTSVAATYQALVSDDVILATTGTFTVTLPAASSCYAGQEITVCNYGSGSITVAGAGSDTIVGTATLAQNKVTKFIRVSTGTGAWMVLIGA